MSDLPQEFDLKFLPDWLKEAPAGNRYADYEGESADRPRRDRDDRRGPGGPRPPRRGGPPPRGDSRGQGGNRPQGNRPGGARPGGDRPREGRPQDRRDSRPSDEPRQAPQRQVALKIEFLPEPHAAGGIARQIKGSGRAYAVFATSKLFLERPERHRVRITATEPGILLYQIGDGPASLDRAAVERNAFFSAKDEFYKEETIEGEPIKGNFSNVARCRSTGTLLGPTNHHGYQPALRKLYEERFSRRISFQEFQRDEIETVSDEQAVNAWKEQARSSKTFTTVKEAEPVVFKSAFEAEQHFKKQYLPQLVKSAAMIECTGPASRAGLDRQIGVAVRAAWETESRFPQQVVNGLRPFLMDAALHFFKHRKRILFVSAIKPIRHAAGQVFSDGISAILQALETSPRLKRPELANRILGADHESPEVVARKEQLALDLHYLIQIGHVIEFADGALELPLSPNAKPEQERKPAQTKQGAGPATPTESTDVAAATDAVAESEEITEPEADPAPEASAEPKAAVVESEAVATEPKAAVAEPAPEAQESSPVEAAHETPPETQEPVSEAPEAVPPAPEMAGDHGSGLPPIESHSERPHSEEPAIS
jgi:hypothetical protein